VWMRPIADDAYLSASGAPMRRRNSIDRGRLIGLALSLTAHLAILVGLVWAWEEAPKPLGVTRITVSLVEAPPTPAPPTPGPPAPTASPSAAKAAKPKKPSKVDAHVPHVSRKPSRIVRPKARVDDEPDPDDTVPELTDAQLAGAATAGSGDGLGGGGGGGGVCDMAARVQAALRRDPLVRAAVARTAGKATLVWNGDWVRSRGEDGKGLAAVREAIMWEVAFAPPSCRTQPVRGLVLMSLDAGSARLAVGTGQWRWSDLLGVGR